MGEGPELSQIKMPHGLAHSSKGGGLPGPEFGHYLVRNRRIGTADVHLLFPFGLFIGNVSNVAKALPACWGEQAFVEVDKALTWVKHLGESPQGVAVIAAKRHHLWLLNAELSQRFHLCFVVELVLLAQLHALAGDDAFDRIAHQKNRTHANLSLLKVGLDLRQCANA